MSFMLKDKRRGILKKYDQIGNRVKSLIRNNCDIEVIHDDKDIITKIKSSNWN